MRRNARSNARRSTRKGFTLTEILVALAIFALGGTAIMALFITNARLSRQAMDYTRAAEITRNIRSLMTQSLSRPINTGNDESVYQFYYPETSFTFVPDEYRDEYEQEDKYAREAPTPEGLGGAYEDARVFFKLPDVMFNAKSGDSEDRADVVLLPNESLTPEGGPRSWEAGEPHVFRMLPDPLRRSGALDGLDADDRMFYQFDISVRRSVQRSSVEEGPGSSDKAALEDLYVVHIRIYKGFEFTGDVQNDPYFEWDFYVNASQ